MVWECHTTWTSPSLTYDPCCSLHDAVSFTIYHRLRSSIFEGTVRVAAVADVTVVAATAVVWQAAARLLRLRFRIPPAAWMFVVSVACCQVEVSASGWSFAQSVVCLSVIVKSRQWGGPDPLGAVAPGGGEWVNEGNTTLRFAALTFAVNSFVIM